jgi:fatty acid desaturase
MGPYTLMLHAVLHRPLFRRDARWLEAFIPWVLGPLFGQTPGSFGVHHLGMHHPENNTGEDLSGTTTYRRDSFTGFLHYWATFFFRGLPDLLGYLGRRRRTAMQRQLIVGELAWLSAVVGLSLVSWKATLIVLVLPLVAIRFLMMAGNWAQHAFVDVAEPDNSWRNSTCLVNARYNHNCHNDGYHIVHHLEPGLHWTEMPGWFQERLETFGANDAIVFSGLTNNQVVFWCLMRQQWGRLADAMVDLPGAPVRTREEKIAFLQDRVRRQVAPGLALAAK